MTPCERASFITAIACGIFNACSTEEVEQLAVDLTQLGDTLTTMLVTQEQNKNC